VYLVPYDNDYIIALLKNSKGPSLLFLSTKYGNESYIYSEHDFSVQGWTIPEWDTSNDYNPTTFNFWLEVRDTFENSHMVSINVKNPTQIENGATFRKSDEKYYKNFSYLEKKK